MYIHNPRGVASALPASSRDRASDERESEMMEQKDWWSRGARARNSRTYDGPHQLCVRTIIPLSSDCASIKSNSLPEQSAQTVVSDAQTQDLSVFWTR
ncbi:hypothetical protein EVAR_64458_1 [Eumeta japonica]|uniref:Uncharacterized protein n=1 Tax=Eumeta variegata TaxID=151549 RepID=A0A4C1ZF62_EUMVA|nr:hypothetical protein EVAR_64458_1 [Eumeta japonica]